MLHKSIATMALIEDWLGIGLCIFLVTVGHAQSLGDYRKANSYFPNPFAPYSAKRIPQPRFTNTGHFQVNITEGKVMLPLNTAIAMALQNNLDIAIARYNLAIADTDILRARAGANVRGVETGLVQGTPGGGILGLGSGAPGAGAGGTSGGAGGAGTGAFGLVQSTLGTGAPVESFDPILTASLNIEHSGIPVSNTVLNGVLASFQQHTGTANFNYSQAFATGTSMVVEFDNARATDNSLTTTLVPQVSSNFRFTLRQRLLSGFGTGSNLRFIRIARNNREISDIAFRNQVIATVSQIQNIYWDLVNAYQDVQVKTRSLTLAKRTLDDDRKQVEIGAIPAIEVIRAESEVASREQDRLRSEDELQLQELLIKNAITRDLSDPALALASVIPTDTMIMPEHEPVVATQELVNDALSHRPELSEARIDITNRDLTRKATSNALLPSLDLVAWYGGAGLAGVQNPNNTSIAPGAIARTGYANAFARLFDSSFPDYAVGLNLTVPLRNRAAQADSLRSQLEYRQAELHLKQLENQIGIEVRNAQFAVQQNRSKVEAAEKALALVKHTAEIEEKKYALGASTSYQVLQIQRDVAQGESNVVAAMSAYEKSRVELDRATGMTLAHAHIIIQEVENGSVKSEPVLPDIAPRASAADQVNLPTAGR